MHRDAETAASGATKPFVIVTEVGTRDGLQIERTPVPAARRIDLVNDMSAAGLRSIEVTSFVSPKAVPQLADAEEVLAGIVRGADTRLSALVPNLRAAERGPHVGRCRGAPLLGVQHAQSEEPQSQGRRDPGRPAGRLLQSEGGRKPKMLIGAVATAFRLPVRGRHPGRGRPRDRPGLCPGRGHRGHAVGHHRHGDATNIWLLGVASFC